MARDVNQSFKEYKAAIGANVPDEHGIVIFLGKVPVDDIAIVVPDIYFEGLQTVLPRKSSELDGPDFDSAIDTFMLGKSSARDLRTKVTPHVRDQLIIAGHSPFELPRISGHPPISPPGVGR